MTRDRFPKSALALLLGGLALLGCAGPSAPAADDAESLTAQAHQALSTCVTIRRGTLGAVEDTTITPTGNYPGWSSTSTTFRAGGTYEALLKFDVSSIPSTATVNSATLSLTTAAPVSNQNLFTNVALAPWSESTVTFASFNQQIGKSAGILTPSATNTTQTLSLIASRVQGWVNGTIPNYGLVLQTMVTQPSYWQETVFVSSDAPTVAQRPALTVCYTTVDYCAPAPCQNGGTCQGSATGYTCACAPGFTGTNCEINIDECAGNPCQNGGSCTDGVNSYSCACAPGYTGSHCQTDINECAPAPCQNGGTCSDLVNAYACSCPPGFSGTNCEINIDECAGQPCLNGGACTDGVNGYTCACATGFTGANCQTNIDDCAGNACQNGSVCVDGIAAYTCACPPGFGGAHCENNLDDCAGSPCLNGGTCVDGVSSYTCACAPGYTGANCEIDINECAGVICQHGGTCVDGVNTYACNCPANWTGQDCEVDVDECASGDPCNLGAGLGASCTNTPGSFTCQCAPNHFGTTCDTVCPCFDQSQVDGATWLGWAFISFGLIPASSCTTDASGDLKVYLQGSQYYIGLEPTTCETFSGAAAPGAGPFYPVTASEHAACQVITDAAIAAYGLTCTVLDNCSGNPCQNGGTCTSDPTSYTCACPAGWTGTNCEVDVDECASGDPCNLGNGWGAACTNTPGSFTCQCNPTYAGAACDAFCPCLAGADPLSFMGWMFANAGIAQASSCTTSASGDLQVNLDYGYYLSLSPTSCGGFFGVSDPGVAMTPEEHAACADVTNAAIAAAGLTCSAVP